MECPFERLDCDLRMSKDARVVDCLACALTFAAPDSDAGGLGVDHDEKATVAKVRGGGRKPLFGR